MELRASFDKDDTIGTGMIIMLVVIITIKLEAIGYMMKKGDDGSDTITDD